MLDRLIQLIIDQINNVIPIVAVYQYYKGVRFRFGKYHDTLNPGWFFKIPWIDKVLVEQVVDTTIRLAAQSMHTNDNVKVVAKAAIGYCIMDIRKFVCNVWDTRSALADRSMVIVKDVLSSHSFEYEVNKQKEINNEMTKAIRKEVFNYGIKVYFLALTDFTNSPSLRLYNETFEVN